MTVELPRKGHHALGFVVGSGFNPDTKRNEVYIDECGWVGVPDQADTLAALLQTEARRVRRWELDATEGVVHLLTQVHGVTADQAVTMLEAGLVDVGKARMMLAGAAGGAGHEWSSAAQPEVSS